MNTFAIAFILTAPVVLWGQTARGSCSNPFEVGLEAGRHLTMHLRAGDVEIAGTPKPGLRVTCRGDDAGDAGNIKISFAASDLRTYGGPDRDIHFRIEVPDKTNLVVRLTAGNMTVTGITGDKDIELRAGNLTIGVTHPEEYRVADGSVLAGNLNATAFGISKDGLFRNFRKENANGHYRLHVELLAGDLNLK